MRELGRFFRTYCSDRHSSWARHLNQINTWLNCTTHTVTGFTPYELHYGYKPVDRIRTLIDFPTIMDNTESYDVKIELANGRTKRQHERQKNAMRKYNSEKISCGDLVLLRIPKLSNALEK